MVAIEIKGCPKRIHFMTKSQLVPHPRYGARVPHFVTVYMTDSNCPCRQKIREDMTRAQA